MRVMVIIKADKDTEAGVMPTEEQLAAMGRYNEELVNAGIMLTGDGLHPTSRGVRVGFSGDKRTVIPGPFKMTGDVMAGFWMWNVKSMDEAVEWLKRCPSPLNSDTEVEIRQVFSAEDFGEAFTPELQEQEERLRAKLEAQAAGQA
ncbi:MAG: YciI family protein [Rhodocyclaceae bacterium]